MSSEELEIGLEAAWTPPSEPPESEAPDWAIWVGVTLATITLSAVCGLAALAIWSTP